MSSLSSFLKKEGADDALVKVFEALVRASLGVQKEVSRAGLGADVFGARGSENVQGEQQQKLDVYADNLFMGALRACGEIAGLASEEQDNALQFEESLGGSYILMIDPLDGSSNIDVNVAIGTIFAIFKRKSAPGAPLEEGDFLQSGRNVVAAGYINYSVSTQLVFSVGKGTHIFTLDPGSEAYEPVKINLQIPADGKVYSINEVNFDDFDERLQRYVQHCRDKRTGKGKRMYTGRYIGSLVADFHRNLLKGGIYVYPATKDSPKGKLRLMYECIPMSFLAEQAGGSGSNGTINVLDIQPEDIHQRCPLYVGSPVMMEEALG